MSLGAIPALRLVAERAGQTGSAGSGSGPVRIDASGPEQAATGPVLIAATGGGSEADALAAPGEPLELPEFPEDGDGTTGPGVDINGLAAAISRPLAAGNGDYSVQVSLHPPELGEVRALLSLQGDALHVTLTPEHSDGYEALSEAMPALHDQLGGGGVEVNVTLGHPGDPQGGASGRGDDPGAAGTTPAATATPASATTLTGSGDPGRIHLIL